MGLFDLFKIGQFKKENAELKQRIDSLNSDNSMTILQFRRKPK